MTPPATSPESQFWDEGLWEELIPSLEEGRIIPIIGPNWTVEYQGTEGLDDPDSHDPQRLSAADWFSVRRDWHDDLGPGTGVARPRTKRRCASIVSDAAG